MGGQEKEWIRDVRSCKKTGIFIREYNGGGSKKMVKGKEIWDW